MSSSSCWTRPPRGGADNVLALRGDPPRGEAEWTAPDGGVQSSLELTALAAEAGFCVLGAAYPEPHPDSRGWAEDLAHLRAKVDAGVRVLVTQLFFDNDDYRRLVDRAAVRRDRRSGAARDHPDHEHRP